MKLTNKLITLVMITVLVIIVFYIILVNQRINQHLSANQVGWVETVAKSISESLIQDTINREKLRVKDVLEKIVHNEEAIEFAYVTDMQGKLFTHSFSNGFPNFLLEKDKEIQHSHGTHILEYQTKQGKIIEFHIALIDGLDARLHLGLNQKEINSVLTKINSDLLIGMSIIGAGVFLVISVIGNRISQPLVQFTRQLKRTDQSKIQFPNPDRLDPDIRELTTTFKNLIDERDQIWVELEKHKDHLEDLVVERTLELQTAVNELEAFSYSVSHDLRSPLRGIDGFSQILLDDYHDELDDEGKEYFLRIRSAAQKMGRLIDDLLMLSRASRDQLKRSAVNISELAHQIVLHFQENAPNRNVEILIQPQMTISGDANLLNSVIENLLGNAWKYTSKNPHARIEFGCKSEGLDKVFFVKDNGVGFDMQYKNKLFNAFQRLHNDIDFPGTGIGLALVQRIVHRHGGKVWAESDLNQGTSFYFSLPV